MAQSTPRQFAGLGITIGCGHQPYCQPGSVRRRMTKGVTPGPRAMMITSSPVQPLLCYLRTVRPQRAALPLENSLEILIY